ncbi:MAG TPA: OsmC family protein [Thermoanaerobaculia bacterium]|nr:OsmC family protein [Thermoanaerobaculia bacterium]
MPARTASAVWTGDLKSGKGTMKLGSGAWEGAFSFQSRFEEGAGTNPEELAGAAHAGCFSMAFSNELSKAGFVPTRVATTAKVHLEKGDAGFSITRIDLTCEAAVPGIDNARFQEIAAGAKKGCPISKLFTGAQINLDAKLV